MLSLFSDNTKSLNRILSDKDKQINPLKDYDSLSLSPSNSELTFAFFTYDKDKY
jgi:hypothetical protein